MYSTNIFAILKQNMGMLHICLPLLLAEADNMSVADIFLKDPNIFDNCDIHLVTSFIFTDSTYLQNRNHSRNNPLLLQSISCTELANKRIKAPSGWRHRKITHISPILTLVQFSTKIRTTLKLFYIITSSIHATHIFAQVDPLPEPKHYKIRQSFTCLQLHWEVMTRTTNSWQELAHVLCTFTTF